MALQHKIIPRKIAILGFRETGKTSLATHYVEGRFVERYVPTIENTFQTKIPFHRVKFSTQIIDCAGMDEYSRLSRNASVGVHGYLIVFSVNSRTSFEKVKFIEDMLREIHGGWTQLPRVLVATMIDTAPDQREVSYEEGQELADCLEIPYVECSTKGNVNVSEVFTTLIREIEKDNILFEEQDSSDCDLLNFSLHDHCLPCLPSQLQM